MKIELSLFHSHTPSFVGGASRIILIFKLALLLLILATSFSDVFAGDRYSEVFDDQNYHRSGIGIEGVVVFIGAIFLLLFGWGIWGKKSIRYVYGPALLGSIPILYCGNISGYKILFVPIVGLLIGYLLIFLGILFVSVLGNSSIEPGAVDCGNESNKKIILITCQVTHHENQRFGPYWAYYCWPHLLEPIFITLN